jgi:type I restriction enzyme S subunit
MQDIFFVRSSLKRDGIAKVACVRDLPEPAVFECHLVRAQLRESVADPVYMTYFLNSERVRDRLIALSTTTTMTTIGQTSLGSLAVAVPPVEEQRTILAMLERDAERHFALVAKTSSVVDRLREYRQALITAAVTGKLDASKEAA